MCEAPCSPMAVTNNDDFLGTAGNPSLSLQYDDLEELKKQVAQLSAQHEHLLLRVGVLEKQQAQDECTVPPPMLSASMAPPSMETSELRCEGHCPEKTPSRTVPTVEPPKVDEVDIQVAVVVNDESDGPLMEQLLQPSFWDALTIVGLPHVGITSSFLIVMGALTCLGLQASFIKILSDHFLEPDSKYDVDFLTDWRALVGHSVKHHDDVSDSTLVSRMCNGKPFDREWWFDALMEEIDASLMPFMNGLTSGSVLSSISICVWLAHIAKDLQLVLHLFMATLRTPRGKTCLANIKPHGRACQRRFQSMGLIRRSLIWMTLLLRFVLAVLLGATGAMWLARTRDMDDIIQNAVALVFILELDELFFHLFGPLHAKQVLSSVVAPNVPRTKTLNNFVSLCSLLVFCIVVSSVVLFEVSSNAESAREVRETVCGGNVDFLVDSGEVGPFALADATPFSDATRGTRLSKGMLPLLRAVVAYYDPEGVDENQQLWKKDDVEGIGRVHVRHLRGGPLMMEDFKWKESIVQADFGVTCKDVARDDIVNGWWLWGTMEAMTGATNCQDASYMCHRGVDMPLLFMLCPETCGCSDPLGGQYYVDGCMLDECEEEWEWNVHLNNSSGCGDFKGDDQQLRKAWREYWLAAGRDLANDYGPEYASEIASVAEGNCATFSAFTEADNGLPQHLFCFASIHRRSISAFCPETCGCFEIPLPTIDDPEFQGMWCPDPRSCEKTTPAEEKGDDPAEENGDDPA